jgi:hypothetical protein
MKKNHLFILFLGSSILFSCQKELSPKLQNTNVLDATEANSSQAMKMNTFYGPEVSMGGGKIRSFITISHTGVPGDIGIEITDGALTNLPTSEAEYSYMLPLHHKASEVTPFDHIEVDWNPNGHEPNHVYTVPHFDFHFYKISVAEQQAVTPGPLMEILPPPGAMPPNYISLPGGVPAMGKHWVDVTSPELSQTNPQPFTKTFIYGSYNGKVTFDEPMITLAVLQSGQNLTTPIPQPTLFLPSSTYYPTVYNITADQQSKKHFVSLSDFVFR